MIVQIVELQLAKKGIIEKIKVINYINTLLPNYKTSMIPELLKDKLSLRLKLFILRFGILL